MKPQNKYKALISAHSVALQIAALEKEDDIESLGPKILGIMRGVDYSTWIVLDEQSGRFDFQDRFYMLRQVRNHSVYGRKLFAGLRK